MRDPNDPTIICPALRALKNDDQLPSDPAGRVKLSALGKALDGLKFSGPLVMLLKGMATVSNRVPSLPHNILTRSFNPARMEEGPLKHRADTGIIGNGDFDADRFDMMEAMSSDGEGLTLPELAAVIAADQRRDPSLLGVGLSMVELGAMFDVFSEPNSRREPCVKLTTLRALFEGAQLPAGFQPTHPLGIIGLFATVFRLAANLPDMPAILFRQT